METGLNLSLRKLPRQERFLNLKIFQSSGFSQAHNPRALISIQSSHKRTFSSPFLRLTLSLVRSLQFIDEKEEDMVSFSSSISRCRTHHNCV
jgi:hypothetical protein